MLCKFFEGRLVPSVPLKSGVVDLVETIKLSLELTLAVEVARAEASSLIPLSATTRPLATLATLSIETMLLPRDSGGVLRPATTVTVVSKVWSTTEG